MPLSNSITDLITAYKAMPNGERRNKIVSHLKDAEAHAKLQELEDPRLRTAAEESSLDSMAPALNQDGSCICKPGMRNRSCPASNHYT